MNATQSKRNSGIIKCRKCNGGKSTHDAVCPICNGSGRIQLHTHTSRKHLEISELGMLLYG